MKKKPTLVMQLFALAAAAYYVAALIKDADRIAFNARRMRADPSLANLAKLLVAEGVLIARLGSI